MREAFPDLTRQTHIAMGGRSQGKADGSDDGAWWVGGSGYLVGTQIKDVFGIPVRNQTLRLRWGEFLAEISSQLGRAISLPVALLRTRGRSTSILLP